MGLVVEECQCKSVPDNRERIVNITLRTLALMRRNQRLQYRLNLLQAETRAFVQSVLSSPTPSHWGFLIYLSLLVKWHYLIITVFGIYSSAVHLWLAVHFPMWVSLPARRQFALYSGFHDILYVTHDSYLWYIFISKH